MPTPDPSAFRTARFRVVLPAAWLAYLVVAWQAGWYQPLLFQPLDPLFADLLAVLAASDCHALGHDVFVANPCDPWSRPHVYGRPWLWLSALGIGRRDLVWLGPALDGLFIATTCWLLRRAGLRELPYALLVVASPAVLLAMERANNDLVILLLLVAAVALATRWNVAGRVAGIVLAVAATALKLYPAVILAELVLGAHGRGWRRRCALLSALLLAAWLAWSFADVAWLVLHAPYPEGPLTFGGALLFRLLGVDHPDTAALVAGIALAVVALLLGRRLPVPASLAGSFAESLGNAAGLVLAFTFIVNSNFDYRLVFVVATLPLLFALRAGWPRHGAAWRLSALLMGCAAYAMWAALPKYLAYAAAARGTLPEGALQAGLFVITLAERLAEWAFVAGLMTLVAAVSHARRAPDGRPGSRRDPAG